jgi:hypothetical protein
LHQLAPNEGSRPGLVAGETDSLNKAVQFIIMARKPKFVAPETRQGLMKLIFTANGQTKLFPFVLMMENEIRRRNIDHPHQMDLHVGAGDILCSPACIGVDDGIAPARHDIDGMSR